MLDALLPTCSSYTYLPNARLSCFRNLTRSILCQTRMATAILKGTIVITGTNGDLGHSIAARIASSHDLATNYYGIYAVRDSSSAGPLLGALQQEQTPGSHPHQVVSVNLERLDNVRELAESINNQVPRGEIPVVRTLILNAGYLQHEKQRWVEGDLDVTWVVNYLSQWLLTLLLLQSMDRDHGRIIVLGPCSHIHE